MKITKLEDIPQEDTFTPQAVSSSPFADALAKLIRKANDAGVGYPEIAGVLERQLEEINAVQIDLEFPRKIPVDPYADNAKD